MNAIKQSIAIAAIASMLLATQAHADSWFGGEWRAGHWHVATHVDDFDDTKSHQLAITSVEPGIIMSVHDCGEYLAIMDGGIAGGFRFFSFMQDNVTAKYRLDKSPPQTIRVHLKGEFAFIRNGKSGNHQISLDDLSNADSFLIQIPVGDQRHTFRFESDAKTRIDAIKKYRAAAGC